jgi:hypothetical protein
MLFAPASCTCCFSPTRCSWLKLIPTIPSTARSGPGTTAWLAPVGLILCGRSYWRKARHTESGERAAARLGLWCVACFAILAVAMIPPTVAGFCATMRYLGDATFGFLLLAVLGAFSLYERARERPVLRRSLVVGLCLAAAATIAMGLLLGVQGYENHFKKHNLELYSKLDRALSLCPKPK